MATPLSADKFLSVLKNARLGVVEHGSWRTHNRDRHGNWGPVNGVMIHHTGSYSSEDDMVERICAGEREGLKPRGRKRSETPKPAPSALRPTSSYKPGQASLEDITAFIEQIWAAGLMVSVRAKR
ncbi:hypothetical protein AB0I98_08800 [Streptomyces sp. NPDC050211]|uniref:hypothetical protein n=1 Tax=Streptomyces sp. NPDC050211 TaxID=3154932 RepID=UPI003434F9EB